MNAASILRPSPGYSVTFEEDLGSQNLAGITTRHNIPSGNWWFIATTLSPIVIFQTYDDFNGIQNWTMNYRNPKSAMSRFGLGHWSSENVSLSTLVLLNNNLGNDHNTGALDLRANHCIYLHSPNLTNYNVLGPSGSRCCLARIAVNNGYGSILTHQHSGHMMDYIPCGGVTLQTLSFELRNANNEVVGMRGGHVSFFSVYLSVSPLVKKQQ